MNIYLISQDLIRGYDSYKSAVVVAETWEKAQQMHPSYSTDDDKGSQTYQSWPLKAQRHLVSVKLLGPYIGDRTTPGVICALCNS